MHYSSQWEYISPPFGSLSLKAARKLVKSHVLECVEEPQKKKKKQEKIKQYAF